MKTADIVAQIMTILPRYTNLFSDEISISSLTASGSTVTATTATAHGLVTGQNVAITGAITPIIISKLVAESTDDPLVSYGVATTNFDHDLTLGYQDTVTITGATQADYNNTFDLIDVPNRYNFVFEMATPAVKTATGSPVLNMNLKYGYNGFHTVTVLNATQFTYSLNDEKTRPLVASPALGTIKMRKGFRISGAISIERFIQGYTKQLEENLWLCVVLGGSSASKDPYIRTDSTYTHTNGQDYRQRIIDPFSVFVFVPTTNSISGMNERDLIEDVGALLFKSILRFQPTSLLSDRTSFGITYSGQNFYSYNTAYYIHEFKFETNYDITYNDTLDTDDSRAFRDIDLKINSYFSQLEIMRTNINLDDDPNFPPGNFKLIDGGNFKLLSGGNFLLQE